MPKVELTSIPKELLSEWQHYAEMSGLPLEYMILEAVTHSVRSDRLGVYAAEHQRNLRAKRTLKENKKIVQKVTPLPPEVQSEDDEDVVISPQLVAKHVDLESTHSAESLEDYTPTNV